MLARDIMSTPVQTVHPETLLEDVVELLLSKRIGAVIVSDDAGVPVGVVSESDLLYRVAHYGLPPHIEILGSIIYLDTPGHMKERLHKATAVNAKDIMSGPVISVAPDLAVEDLADILISKKVHRVLVMEDGVVRGLVTRGDVVRQCLARQFTRKS